MWERGKRRKRERMEERGVGMEERGKEGRGTKCEIGVQSSTIT